jgi:WD40 repeat protein
MFLREFNHVITKNPIQVHVSALHFTPRSSTIWKNFIEIPRHSTLVKSGAETYWPSTQMSLRSTMGQRRRVSFSPNGRLLAETCEPDITSQVTVQIWDLDGFFTVFMTKLLFHLAPLNQIIKPKLVFSPDSEILIVLHWHSVQVLNFLQKYEPDVYMFSDDIEDTTTAVAPDGFAFALGSPENAIEIWRVQPRGLYRKTEHGCPLSLSSGGTRLLYSLQKLSGSCGKRTIKCWHADTGVLVDIADSQCDDQFLSSDGMLILLISTGCASVHDSNTGSLLFRKRFHDWVDAALSPDATHLAAVVVEEGGIYWIHIIEMKSGRLKAAYPGMGSLAWSPSSTMLVFQDSDGGIFLWEQCTNGDMVLTCSGYKDNSLGFAISPDDHVLVPLHTNGEIPLLVLTSHTKTDTPQLRFSMDGPGFPQKDGETALLGIPLGPSPLDGAVDYISESRYLVTAFEISSNGCLIGRGPSYDL